MSKESEEKLLVKKDVQHEENSSKSTQSSSVKPLESEVRLVRVHSAELEALREYVEALYAHDEDFEAMVHIDEGLRGLMKNEALATAYFIFNGPERVGYTILTRYFSVEKGGLTVFIDELYVEASFRRARIGVQVIQKVLQIARLEGAKAIWVQAEPHNLAAVEFFKAQGFLQNSNLNFEWPL